MDLFISNSKPFLVFGLFILSLSCFSQDRPLPNVDLQIAQIQTNRAELTFVYNNMTGYFEDTFSEELNIIIDTFSNATVLFDSDGRNGFSEVKDFELWDGVNYSGKLLFQPKNVEDVGKEVDILLGFSFLANGKIIFQENIILFKFTEEDAAEKIFFPPKFAGEWSGQTVTFVIDTGFQGAALMNSNLDFTRFDTTRLLKLNNDLSFRFPFYSKPQRITESYLVLANMQLPNKLFENFPIVLQSDFPPVAGNSILIGSGIVRSIRGELNFKRNSIRLDKYPSEEILKMHSTGFILSGNEIVNYGANMQEAFSGKSDPTF
jgi:hypothetical protein